MLHRARSLIRHAGLLSGLLCLSLALGSRTVATPATDHPRLWVRSSDVPRLRAWAVDSNPLYRDGLAVLAGVRAKTDMDMGFVPQQDDGGNAYESYPTEAYAELFAFLSLISPDAAARADYAQRARTLLMYVMNAAALGVAAGQPFRDVRFSSEDGDRARYYGESFALTVDWIYPSLSAPDKATIRQVFLRWADEISKDSYPFSPPAGPLNDPSLVSDPRQYRWAGNNYWTAHMRNLGLMAMALDPADDPGGQLHAYLANATGTWLYVVDYLMRHDAAGGLFPEGFEYSPQTVGYAAQFLLALHTAGQDDPAVSGPQVVLTGNPYWAAVIPAYLQSLSPAPAFNTDFSTNVYLPAWYGDGSEYFAADPMQMLGALGVYDAITGNSAGAQDIRWIEANVPPGGPAGLVDRVGNASSYRDAILAFLLFDPAAPAAADPRPAQPPAVFVPGIGRILARTDWSANATWFTYKCGWSSIDHQLGDANQFELYRHGEWLTKERDGYDLDSGAPEDHNTVAIQNDPPDHNDPTDYRHVIWLEGGQYGQLGTGDPTLIHSFGPNYVYAAGDATNLYNSASESATDVLAASRAILWLEPDRILVYDRAETKTANRFKRFWLNFPSAATVSGNRATMATATGQQLFVATLLPADAVLTAEADPVDATTGQPITLYGSVANPNLMTYRLRVDAPGGPAGARFLNVLQAADAGAVPQPASLIASDPSFAGALVSGSAVLFPVDPAASFTSLTYTVPVGAVSHYVTGLAPGAGFSVASHSAGSALQVTITPGGASTSDGGGVLAFTTGSQLVPGDVNADGKVTVADALLAVKIVVGLLQPTALQRQAADVNNDGQVNVLDVLLILRKVVGLP